MFEEASWALKVEARGKYPIGPSDGVPPWVGRKIDSILILGALVALGLSRGRLGASWGRLGAFWERLGGILGRLGGRPGGGLRASWAVL